MALTQQRFLGASIINFSTTIGWGTSPSTLDVALVEDDVAGDVFTAPATGTPVIFEFTDGQQKFKFEGIIQRWRRNCSYSGNPIYEVQLTDPREILEGVQIITGGYNGKVSTIPNILNVYGYYEKQGFGSSESDSNGMPWRKIAAALPILTNALFPSDYGGPILYRDTRYALDISNLPILPDYYKIGSDTNITVMDFINEVCEASASDYFFTQNTNSDGIRFIVLNTISRKNAFVPGQIANYASNTTDKISVSNGLENVNAVCGKMLVGSQKHEMYLQYYNANISSIYEDDTIWPYWGINNSNNVIVGQGIDDNHKFTVDCSFLPVPGLNNAYTMDVAELRSALDGRSSWELFLSSYDNDKNSIHYQKSTRLGLHSDAFIDILVENTKAGKVTLPNEIMAINPEYDPYSIHDYQIGMLYEFVRQYAEEFYGKKFMVRIPFVYVKKDDSTGELSTSRKPIDSAFISESDWPEAIARNILPLDVDKLYTEEGKITAYVKFDLIKFNDDGTPVYFDLTEISPEDIVLNFDGTSAFIKCSVEPYIVYLDSSTYFSPRAVITLPGCVRIKPTNNPYNQNIVDLLKSKIEEKDRPSNFNYVVQKSLSSIGYDNMFYGKRGICVLPTMAAIPLENEQDTYGPWVRYGANGKMEFEKDDGMNPWNFGGDYSVMNTVGTARVSEVMANLVEMESGAIEIPGVPNLNLGSALVESGPYITRIDVSFGNEGIRTNYTMEIWSPRFGKLQKAYIDRMAKFAKIQNRNRRQNRFLLQKTIQLRNVNRIKGGYNLAQAGGKKSKRVMNQSTHAVLCGQTVNKSGEYKNIISTLPNYSIDQVADKDGNKGGMSMDGLFIPFAAYEGNTNLPSFNSKSINHVLNPYAPGKHNISFILRESSTSGTYKGTKINFDKEYNIKYKPLALRSPLVLAGWGKDTDGNPFPSGGDGNFRSDYRVNQSGWKVGPLDVRWDESEGVWQATGGSLYCTTLDGNNQITLNGKKYNTVNCLGITPCSGSNVIVTRYNSTVATTNNESRYLIVNAGLCEQEITFVKDITCNKDGSLIISKQTIKFYGTLGSGITVVS